MTQQKTVPEALEEMKKETGMRYGQILNNALQTHFHTNGMDRTTKFDTFYLDDHVFVQILEDFHMLIRKSKMNAT